MGRVGVAVLALLLAVAWFPGPASAGAGGLDLGALEGVAVSGGPRRKEAAACAGAVGECGVNEEEEMGLGGDGASEALLRRALAQRQPTNRYISYAALRADQVPCNQRGKSYYTNCASQKPANPYRRGCSAITRCQRNTN